jgi:hypothetical protein
MFIKRTRDRKRKGEKSKGERVGSGSEVVVERKLERESQDLDLALSPSFLSTPLEGAAVGIVMGGIPIRATGTRKITSSVRTSQRRKGKGWFLTEWIPLSVWSDLERLRTSSSLLDSLTLLARGRSTCLH